MTVNLNIIFWLSSALIEVFVVKPSDVPDTSIHVPETASLVVRGESGTVSTDEVHQFNLNVNFTPLVLFIHFFLPKDSSELYHYEERTEVKGTKTGLCN